MNEKENYFGVFLFVGFILIILSLSMCYFEIKPAINFCKNINGVYSLSILEQKHFCNGEVIIKFKEISFGNVTKGWDFETNVDERSKLFDYQNEQKQYESYIPINKTLINSAFNRS